MLLILKRTPFYPSSHCRCASKLDKVLAFHHAASGGKAITLPHWAPTTSQYANRIMHDLEVYGVSTGH